MIASILMICVLMNNALFNPVIADMNTDMNNEYIIAVLPDDYYGYTTAVYIQNELSSYNLDISIIQVPYNLLGDTSWDMAIVDFDEQERPYFNRFMGYTAEFTNFDRIEMYDLDAYTKSIQRLMRMDYNFTEYLNDNIEMYTANTISVPLFYPQLYYSGDLNLSESASIVNSIKNNIREGIMYYSTEYDSYNIFNSDINQGDPITSDTLVLSNSQLLLTDHMRVEGLDYAVSYTISDFINHRFENIPPVVKNGEISFELSQGYYSDGERIIPADFIFSLQLNQIHNSKYLNVVDYKIDNDIITFYLSDSGITDLYDLGKLTPTPTHLLNKTLHIELDATVYPVEPLSTAYSAFDTIEWNTYEELLYSSSRYIPEIFSFADRLQYISFTGNELWNDTNALRIELSVSEGQSGNISRSYTGVHTTPNYMDQYHLLFNFQRFYHPDSRAAINSLIDREYIANITNSVPLYNYINPNYEFAVQNTDIQRDIDLTAINASVMNSTMPDKYHTNIIIERSHRDISIITIVFILAISHRRIYRLIKKIKQ